MRPTLFDIAWLGGSLAVAIVWRAITGDTESADRLGLSVMMSWAALQALRYAAHGSKYLEKRLRPPLVLHKCERTHSPPRPALILSPHRDRR